MGAYVDNIETVRFDTINDSRSVITLEGSMGIERKVNLYKKFQVFFGADFFIRYFEVENISRQSRYTWDNRYTKSNDYGIAPFIGFRYKLNNRISITTESNIKLFYTDYHNGRNYFPDNQYGYSATSKKWKTEYTPPTSIYVTFNF